MDWQTKLSKLGLLLCGLYSVVAIPILVWANFGVDDFKGRYILNQFAVAPAMLFLTCTGVIDLFFDTLPWMNNVLAMFAMSFAVLYAVGIGLTAVIRFDARYREKRKYLD